MSNEWVGVPCSSRWWVFTADLSAYFARRGVAALATHELLDVSADPPGAVLQSYLRSAVQLLEILKVEEEEIAAEAIAIGMSWDVVGHALGIERTAAQKAYGHLCKRGRPATSCLDLEWSRAQVGGARRIARRQICMLSYVVNVSVPSRIVDPSQEWIGVLAWLSSARSLQRAAELTIREIVEEMRCAGITWRDIASGLGVGTTAAQKRFRAGLPVNRPHELRHEKRAVERLQQLAEVSIAEYDPEGPDFSVALNYSADSLKRACEYGSVIYEDIPQISNIDTGVRVQKARTAIENAANSLATPGTFQFITRVVCLFDEVNAPYLEHYYFLTYVYFMQLLSFEYTIDAYKAEEGILPGVSMDTIKKLAWRYIRSVSDGLDVAKEALRVIDKLHIRNLYPLGTILVLLELLEEKRRGNKMDDPAVYDRVHHRLQADLGTR